MEINYKILNYLDAKSLCRSAQVSKRWREISDDDVIWRRMCSQHIDKTCTKCGWGLPLMTETMAQKRGLSPSLATAVLDAPLKKQRISSPPPPPPSSSSSIPPSSTSHLYNHSAESTKTLQIAPLDPIPLADQSQPIMIKSWKQIFSERSVVARNWRKPTFNSRNLIGHTDG